VRSNLWVERVERVKSGVDGTRYAFATRDVRGSLRDSHTDRERRYRLEKRRLVSTVTPTVYRNSSNDSVAQVVRAREVAQGHAYPVARR
jgi:hypothetical protein